MAVSDTPPTDPLLIAMLKRMIETGIFDRDDVLAVADDLEAQGETAKSDLAKAVWVEAMLSDPTEWRRAQMKVVPIRPDGGNVLSE